MPSPSRLFGAARVCQYHLEIYLTHRGALLNSRATAPGRDTTYAGAGSPTVREGSETHNSMVRDFDDNEFPLAYLISFRTYGTWLHGDNRGSTSRKQNKYRTPRIAPNSRLQRAELKQLKHQPVKLDSRQRPVVEQAVREVCANRGYWLQAINVRTNHVHTVVSASIKPEPILQAFQAYATRKLRRAGLLPEDVKPWTRHGSTPYLWKERHVERAIDYVVNGQGDELPSFDD